MSENIRDDTPTEALLAAGTALDALLESHWEFFRPLIAQEGFVARWRRELMALNTAVDFGLTLSCFEQAHHPTAFQTFAQASNSISRIWQLCRASYHGHLRHTKHLKALLVTSPYRPDVLTDALFILEHLPSRLAERQHELLGQQTVMRFIADAPRHHAILHEHLARVDIEPGLFNAKGWHQLGEDFIPGLLRDLRMGLLEADVHYQPTKAFIRRLKERVTHGMARGRIGRVNSIQGTQFTALCRSELVATGLTRDQISQLETRSLARLWRDQEHHRDQTRLDMVEALALLTEVAPVALKTRPEARRRWFSVLASNLPFSKV